METERNKKGTKEIEKINKEGNRKSNGKKEGEKRTEDTKGTQNRNHRIQLYKKEKNKEDEKERKSPVSRMC